MGSQAGGALEESDDTATPDSSNASGLDAVSVESLLYPEVQLTTMTRRAMQVRSCSCGDPVGLGLATCGCPDAGSVAAV